MLEQNRRQSLLALVALGLFYSFAVLPLLFFRHDDWWILGNSVRYLPGNWGFLWKPTLFHGGREIIWFFRPGFKFLVYLFYGVFGFHYFWWMASLVAIFVASLWVGFLTVVRVSGSSRNGMWFIAAAGASFLLHFGSLAWMGEGIMNVPQLFLLVLCTYGFARADGSLMWAALSWASFLGALCFKESSLFHTALLLGMCVAEPHFRKPTWVRTLSPLVPFALMAAVYLFIRLGRMPYNPSYVAAYTFDKVLHSSVSAFGPLLLPAILWTGLLFAFRVKALPQYFRSIWHWVFYVPFIACSLALYVGQDFFSPGWLLVVGISTLQVFAFRAVPAEIEGRFIWSFALALFLLSSIPVAMRLHSVGWWQWHAAQDEVFQAVSQAPAGTKFLAVRRCTNPKFPGVEFERVIANEEGLRQMAFLTHQREIPVRLLFCEEPIPAKKGMLVLEWRFPKLEKVDFLP